MQADSPNLLVVDDDPRMAESLVALLESAGYRNIQTLNEPHAAVAHINAREYDLVLLDVMMPGMTGFELLDALDRTGMNTAFIILTGDASMESAS
ncbi:MAG: response regulator [Gammaproteobacteria bacterium]|nr:response regulator [Gammaproteobacteria bacterium]